MLRLGWNGLLAAMFLLKLWKHAAVWRFFRRPLPSAPSNPPRVTILQPILSGDPTLEESLQENLRMRTAYPVQWLWLIDTDDDEAQAITERLRVAHPHRDVQLIQFPPPPLTSNPKTAKLASGMAWARGEILCVLDDDTCLPDGALEQCLPLLDAPSIGLVFGLPYYRSWQTPWSTLVSLFVNGHSLLTYVPYTSLTRPFTINGMFYAVRRAQWEQWGGWRGLETILADDFAVAQRVRDAGYHVHQSALRHPIRTTVKGPIHYFSLIQRWFIFPRESLLRHLPLRERLLLGALALFPALFPLLLLAKLLLRPTRALGSYILLYFAHSLLVYAHFDRSYLRKATPWPLVPLAPLVEVFFPFQLLVALLAPQRIVWRGHHIEVERGGRFRLRRREQ